MDTFTDENSFERAFTELVGNRPEMVWNQTYGHSGGQDPPPEAAVTFGQPVDPLTRPIVRWSFVVVFISVASVGIIANALVLYTVTASQRLRSITGNVFIACLAVSDLWLCSFSGPVQLHYQLTDRWAFGQVLCRIVFATFAVPVYVSALSILWIAIDRYRLIVHPLAQRWTPSAAVGIIVASVLVSFIIAIPVVHYTTLFSFDDDVSDIHISYCFEKWPAAGRRRAYSIVTFTLQFCLPLSATIALYVRIYARLRTRRHRLRCRSVEQRSQQTSVAELGRCAASAGGGPAARGRSRNTRYGGERTTGILIAIVVSFIVCWLPWNVLSLIAELDRSALSGSSFKLIDLCLKIFALIGSSCINPFLYCWLNDGFRAELVGSFANIRLRVFGAAQPNGNVVAATNRMLSGTHLAHAKRHRPDAIDVDRNAFSAAAAEASDLQDPVDMTTDFPRLEVCSPSSVAENSQQLDAVTHSDQLTWCGTNNDD